MLRVHKSSAPVLFVIFKIKKSNETFHISFDSENTSRYVDAKGQEEHRSVYEYLYVVLLL